MLHSIKAKITLLVCGILIIVVGTQIIANFLFAEEFYVNRKSKRIESVYQHILKRQYTSEKEFLRSLTEYEENNNIQFIIANEDLKGIYNSREAFGGKYKSYVGSYNFKKKVDKFKIDAKPMRYEKYGKSKSSTSNTDRLQLRGIVTVDDKPYYVVMRSKIAAIRVDMKETNMFILYISTIALIFGTICAYVFAKRLSRPIEEIGEVANNVSCFDFTKKVPNLYGYDELGRLAENINKMSSNLEKALGDLQESNKELKLDNKYMNRIDSMRKAFIANVSHELKTPLSIMTGYTEMLKSDVEGIDKDYYYDVIMDECRKMSELINNMLNLSNMENGLSNLELAEVDISQLIRSKVDKKSILMEQEGLTIVDHIEDGCIVLANELYIDQVFNNYLSNAIKHTKPGGKIDITVTSTDDEVIVHVINEGEPIDVGVINKIWDSFYKVDESRVRDGENHVGLGLYIVRTIINAHQGKYGVMNCKEGVTFWFQLKKL